MNISNKIHIISKKYQFPMKDKIISLWYKAKDLRIRRFWGNLGRWLSYYPVARNVYDWDYTSILAVERHQIERVRNSIAHYQHHLYAKRDIERMDLALRLLDIIEEDGCSEYHGEDLRFNEDNTIWLDQNAYYTIPVYVNYHNANRFFKQEQYNYEDSKRGALHRDHLRIEKAWHIYHRLRMYYLRSWWD